MSLPAETLPYDAHINEAEQVWRQLEEIFTNIKGMSFDIYWWAGGNARLYGQRMRNLEKRPAATQLHQLIAPLTNGQLAYLKDRANINLNQAQNALRLFIIANLSVPIGGLVLINQIIPGSIFGIFDSLSRSDMYIVGGAILLPMLFAVWFSYAGVYQARDGYHLITLHLSRRLMINTITPEIDDMPDIENTTLV